MNEFDKACLELDMLLEKSKSLNLEISEARLIRNMLCTHTVLETKNYYYSGSYSDKAYTTLWEVCLCCGKKLDERTIEHNYYG
jgi:hypothetical protein